MPLKQPVGRKKTSKIAAMLKQPVVKAFVNGDLPHGVAVAFVQNGDVYFVNLKKRRFRCYVRGGKLLMHKTNEIKPLSVQESETFKAEKEREKTGAGYNFTNGVKCCEITNPCPSHGGKRPISQMLEEDGGQATLFNSPDVVELKLDDDEVVEVELSDETEFRAMREEFLHNLYKEEHRRRESETYRWNDGWSSYT